MAAHVAGTRIGKKSEDEGAPVPHPTHVLLTLQADPRALLNPSCHSAKALSGENKDYGSALKTIHKGDIHLPDSPSPGLWSTFSNQALA